MTEWNESDWDPEKERNDAKRKVGSMGMTWPSFMGLLRFEHALWEARLDGYCYRRQSRDGVTVHDWAKQKLRSEWRKLLVRKYGVADLDSDVELAPMTDDELEHIKDRVRREFPMTSGGGTPLNGPETDEAVGGALAAMGIRQVAT